MATDSVHGQIDASGYEVTKSCLTWLMLLMMPGRCTLKWLMGAMLLQDLFEESLTYQGATYPGEQALTLSQLEQFIARVHASDA